jgi:RND family efflux transporter MFP subunit
MAKLLPLGLLLFVAACGGGAPPPPPTPVVSVAQPLERTVIDWDDYVGRFEAIQDAEIRPRVSGAVTGLFFRDGQDVAKGQPLIEIDPRPYRAALAQAEADVGRAAATLANARTELARARTLLDAEAESKEEYEARDTAVRTAIANLAAARATAEARRLDVEFTTVRAPISGRISDRRVSIGDYVQEGTTVLTRIVTLDPIWFTFEGSEAFYLKYQRQAARGERASSRGAPNPVEIQLADESGYNWQGRMVFVDNALDTGSGTIRAKAEVANPRRNLTPGMFGRARLLGSGSYQALLVPDEAIVTDQTRKIAYTVGRDNKIVPRVVETGPLVEGLRVVRSGLAPTELVVLDGLTRLQPGAQVKPNRRPLTPRAKNTAPVAQPITTPPAAEATTR